MTGMPNVLFILADQLRASSLPTYGENQIETPNIDRLAGEGVILTNVISSCPVCTPYRSMMLTGRHPQTTGQTHLEPVRVACFGHDPTLPPLPYDPDKARELLTEAGYPDGFEMGLACPSGAYAGGVEACQAIIGYLNEVIDATLEVREANLHWDLECKHEFEPMFFDGAGDRYLDPTYPVNLVMLPDTCWATWDNPEIVELLREASGIVDQDKRKEIYYEVARIMQEDPPGIPLWQVHNFTGLNKRVSGFVPWPTEHVTLRGVRVQD